MEQNKDQQLEEKEFEIRSEEVQDILSYVPNWMIRWGITVIGVIILMIFLMSWVIKYPDTIQGSLTLVTANPPTKLVNQANGKIVKLKVEDGAMVIKGTVIAEIENSLTSEKVDFLKKTINKIKLTDFNQSDFLSIEARDFSFGEIQPSYNQLVNNVNSYNAHISNNYIKSREVTIANKIGQQQQLIKIIENQIALNKRDVKNGKEKYITNKNLFDSGVVSKLDFLEVENEYHQKLKQLESIKSTLINSKIAVTDLQDTRNRENADIEEKQRVFVNEIESAVKNINNFIDKWYLNNTIIAPSDGKLAYLKKLSVNQYVTASESLFTIVPDGDEYVGLIEVETSGVGKVKQGQKVLVKFDNYPYKEFGQVIAAVKSVSEISENNKYLIYAEFLEGLKTSYHHEITYEPEMKGTAEIITNDLRLLERFTNSIRGILDQ